MAPGLACNGPGACRQPFGTPHKSSRFGLAAQKISIWGGFRWKLGREFSQEQITDAGQPVVMLVRGATILRITLVKHNSQKVVSQNEPRTLWSHPYMFDEEAVCHPLRATLVVIA
jgi:hypothetical protein